MTTPRLDARPAARYGPLDRYHPAPAGGMCLSVFVVARRGQRALVGRPAKEDPAWTAWWMPSWAHLDEDERSETLLPGTYLREGEAPEAGARRVLRDMLRAKGGALDPRPFVFSATTPSDWYPGHAHWDLAFVFEAKGIALPARPPTWWRELVWRAPGDVRARDFGWNADLARRVGIAR